MQEAVLREEMNAVETETKDYGSRLFEKWSKKKNLGEGLDKLMDRNPRKARGLAIHLENQEKYLQRLTETQISNDFSTTPQNVIRIVRLGYPNSMRGEVFDEVPMVTARDSVYYLKPVYDTSARGATADAVTHESSAHRYASEYEEDSMGTGDGSTTQFTGPDSDSLNNPPLRPYSVMILVANVPVGTDNGSGTIAGTALNTASTNTIDYTTGAIEINFTVAGTPANGSAVVARYMYDSEVTAQYPDIRAVKLELTDFQLRARPWPLYVSWSKMSELLLSTTLDIDAEGALIQGAADELKKSLDFDAVRLGYRYSLGNSTVTFNASFAIAGADSEVAHAQSVTKVVKQAGQIIYNSVQRGGITSMVAGVDVVPFLTLHNKFSSEGSQPEVGIYKVGTLLGKDVYQAPSAIVPAGEMLGVWKNSNESQDVSIIFGTLIPLYQTQTLEYKEAYKETGLFHFGDRAVLQSDYLVRMIFTNL